MQQVCHYQLINKIMLFQKPGNKLDIINWIKYILILVFLIAIVIYFFQRNGVNQTDRNISASSTANVSTSTVPSSNTTASGSIKKAATTNILSAKCNLKITSPAIYSKVSMPLTITGLLDKADTKKNCMWNENNTRAGEAEVFYNRNGEGWKSSGAAVPMITSSVPGAATTTLKISISLNLYTKALGLTSGTPLKIKFTELNIPPQPNPDTFEFLVYLK